MSEEQSKEESFYLATLFFTNGICPYCKQNISENAGGKNALNPEKAVKHMHDNKHEEDVKKTRANMGWRD